MVLGFNALLRFPLAANSEARSDPQSGIEKGQDVSGASSPTH